MPAAPIDAHESPLRGVEYLQLPLKLMEIAGAQHFSRGWPRETRSTLALEKTCKWREAMKERKFVEVPLYPVFSQVLLLSKQQGAFVLWEATLLNTSRAAENQATLRNGF